MILLQDLMRWWRRGDIACGIAFDYGRLQVLAGEVVRTDYTSYCAARYGLTENSDEYDHMTIPRWQELQTFLIMEGAIDGV